MTSVLPTRGTNARNSSNQAILVTGGSGLIGKQLVRTLAKSNYVTVSMYHHKLPEPMANVYPFCSDMNSIDLLGAPLRGVECVVHLAWEKNIIGAQFGEISLHNPTRNLQNLGNLLRAMELAQTKRIIFMSALGASRSAESPFLQEKYLAEHLVLNSRVPEKIILRSSIVFGGDQDKFVRAITNLMKFPGMYPVPRFGQPIAPIHIADLIESVMAAIKNPLPEPCSIIEMVGKENYRIEDIFRMVSNRFVKGAKLQIKGKLGDSLVPLFESHSKRNDNEPRLRHYLSIGNQVNSDVIKDNPLIEVMPEKTYSFREAIADERTII
jgi:nucleoside-diphosphate-sugar epimerase